MLVAEFGLVPPDFADVWALTELLWQRHVGVHAREQEHAKEIEEARKSAAYAKSVAELKRRQQQG